MVMRMIPDISRASRVIHSPSRLVSGARARAAESYHDNLDGIESEGIDGFRAWKLYDQPETGVRHLLFESTRKGRFLMAEAPDTQIPEARYRAPV